MRVVRVRAHGGAEALAFEQDPEPVVGPGQVLLNVGAVALNHLDLWVRRGVPGHRFPLPLIPGSDIAGTTADGRRFAVVPFTSCGRCPACLRGRQDLCRAYLIRGERCDGGCRERLAVDEADLLPIPEGMSLEEAAALPLTALTAWHMLDQAALSPGETVLVVAGSSGVGAMAIQIARNAGCRVIATAGNEAKRALCLQLGAHEALPHEEMPKGVADVVVEHVGAATWERSLRALAWGGRLVICGATTGNMVQIDLRAVFFKQLRVIGSTMGSREDMRRAWSEVRADRLRATVGGTWGMSEIAGAHAALEHGWVLGKAVLQQDLAEM